MSRDERPDPDAILQVIDQDEKKKNHGHFRLFIGMSAGVGKTYAMLKAAHQKKIEGVDVVAGIIETHGRPETRALTVGLEFIKQTTVQYRETEIDEMDLDAILKRRPKIVLVDELAHTNAPGSRHEKRYQDVLELLENGIDVYSTLNVQHLESRKDAVESVTGISIRETVPDRVLDVANQVELVDIAPNELLKRLREGNVYLDEKADRAAQNFFKEDKLTALREIALRLTAERVDQDLQKFSSVRTQQRPWPINERLLVAFSHSPYSEKLLRATRRLAYTLEAPWVALHVDTGITLNDADQAQLAKNINLAKELNAELITTTEIDIPSAIRRICRQKNVTQVVVGRPTRRWFRDVIEGGSLLDRLVRESLDVDVHIIRHSLQDGTPRLRPKLMDEISYYRSPSGVKKYWQSVGVVVAISMLSWGLESFVGYRSVGFFFLLGVLGVGMFGSLGAVILASLMSAVIWDYFFIPPKFTFAITNPEDILMCISFFIVSLITGFLTNRIRFHERVIREREQKTNALYEILQDITSATEKSEFIKKVIERTGGLLDGYCGVILKDQHNKLDFLDSKYHEMRLSEKDEAVAQWSYENNKLSGWSTDTLSESNSMFVPLIGTTEIVGIFIFRPKNKLRKIDLDKENLLSSIVSQLGAAIEKHIFMRRLAETQRLKDSEKLHQTLLNSISHELRTPLTAMIGAASALDEKIDHDTPGGEANRALLNGIQLAGERLNRVIENLLDMSRLNSGVLTLNLEWHDINDLLGVIVKKLELPLQKHRISFQLMEELILLKIDFRLMEHALANILLNASIYSPEGGVITIASKQENHFLNIYIQDEGPGIPEESLDKVFNKFYRVPGSPTGGTGLGLSIVKSIVELHKGKVQVSNRRPQGLSFVISLPIDSQPLPPEDSHEL